MRNTDFGWACDCSRGRRCNLTVWPPGAASSLKASPAFSQMVFNRSIVVCEEN
jgi:hypothetical protein